MGYDSFKLDNLSPCALKRRGVFLFMDTPRSRLRLLPQAPLLLLIGVSLGLVPGVSYAQDTSFSTDLLETAVLVVAGAVNLLLGGTAFLLWESIRSTRRAIEAEAQHRQTAEERIFSEKIRIEKELDAHRQFAASTFVRRDDYHEDIDSLKSLIQQIIERLDNKVDK